jgi:hypothetical protein
MWFNCFFNHNERKINLSQDQYKYCLKCRKVWILRDVVYTIANPDHSGLRGFKAWKEIKDFQKKKDFWNFLEQIGMAK